MKVLSCSTFSLTNVFNQHLHLAANCICVINKMRDLLFPHHTGSSGFPAVSTALPLHRVCVCVCVDMFRPTTASFHCNYTHLDSRLIPAMKKKRERKEEKGKKISDRKTQGAILCNIIRSFIVKSNLDAIFDTIDALQPPQDPQLS